MSVRNSLIWAVTAALLMVRSAAAQPEARFVFVQPGVDPLKADLKYLVELSPTTSLSKQWAVTLEPLLDSFAEGLDHTKPMRVDMVFGKDIAYEVHFPIDPRKKLDGNGGFIPNIEGFGYNVKKTGENLYTVTLAGGPAANKKPSYMRYVNGYVSIAPTQARVPANLGHPITDKATGVQHLLAKGYDVVGSLKNSAAEIEARRTNFKELRKQLEAGLTARRNEDKNEFALRKLTLTQNLNEAERFVVETEELLVGWTTTTGTKEKPGNGRAEFSLTPLAMTDLAKSSDVLAQKSSYFANVTLSEKGVASGKINFGIDQLRADHLKEFYKTVRPVMEAKIDERPTLKEADQKAAAKEGAGILLDILVDAIQLGSVDLFMDLSPAGDGKHTFLCGGRVMNGKKADDIVKLLPRINTAREVKLDSEKIGDDVSLHVVMVPERRQAAFHKLFPGHNEIFVATSKDAVWGAAGTDAVEKLTAAIKQAAMPAPEKIDPRVLYFTGHAARIVDLLDIVRPEPQPIDEKLSKDEQARLRQQQKDLEKIRKLAADATAKCEALASAEIKKDGNAVVGSIDVSECVLRFVGSVIADFAKDMQ